MPITGGCLCGQTHAEPLWIGHCHCGMCRKHTGAPVATWIGFPAGSVRWVSKEPTRYRSSKDVERSFCPSCGSTIGFHRVHPELDGTVIDLWYFWWRSRARPTLSPMSTAKPHQLSRLVNMTPSTDIRLSIAVLENYHVIISC
jgi:hypothetical protein